MKRCTVCGKSAPLEAFYEQKAGRKGRISQCKKCMIEKAKIYQRQHSKKNPIQEKGNARLVGIVIAAPR